MLRGKMMSIMVHGKPVDPDLVKLVFICYEDENHNRAAVARRIKKSAHWVGDVLRDYDPRTNELKVKKRRGRPRITTTDEDADLMGFVKANRLLSGVKIAAEVDLSHRTVLRRLRENHARRSKAILNGLKPEHMECRINWCLVHLEQYLANPNLFKDVIFTDEVRFDLHGGRLESWYFSGENRTDKELQPDTSVLTKGGIMYWGAIRAAGAVALVRVQGAENSEKYTEILFDHLVPHLDEYGHDLRLLHDGASVHTSNHTKLFLDREGIDVLPWPAKSPDLNVIENVWGLINQHIVQKQPKNLEELDKYVMEAWQTLVTPDYCRTLVESMISRCNECVLNEGARIRY